MQRERGRAGHGLTRRRDTRVAQQVRGREPRGAAWETGGADSGWSCPGGPRPCEGEKGGEHLAAEGNRCALRPGALRFRGGRHRLAQAPRPQRSTALDLIR